MAFSFFHPQKPRQFTYEPRFYRLEDEKDENGRERTEEEKLAIRLENSWSSKRTVRSRRGPNRSIVFVVAITALLIFFISSKAFTRMFEVFGKQPQDNGVAATEQPQHWVVTDSTGIRDTIYKGDIGGIFSNRIDSLAMLGFLGEFGDNEQMKKKLGDEYEMVKMRMDQLNEEYERTCEQAQ